MLKNYFVLNRIVTGLNERVSGFNIQSVFTQDKDIFILECVKNSEQLYIIISVNPHLPYITLRNNFHRAKKNVAFIASDFLPLEIKNVSIAITDRIVKFQLNTGVMYFFIRGGKTNVYISSPQFSISFKKTVNAVFSEFLEEFSKFSYTSGKTEAALRKDLTFQEYKVQYPFLGKEILNEAFTRNDTNPAAGIYLVINDIYTQKAAVYRDESHVVFSFMGFQSLASMSVEYFDDLFEAVNTFIYLKLSTDAFLNKKKIITAGIEKELERTASKLNNLKTRIDAGSKEEEYNKAANLLLINIDKIIKGQTDLILEDIYNNGGPVKIKLDPSLPPRRNVDRYYEKARSERINYVKSRQLYEVSLIKYRQLKDELSLTNKAQTLKELKVMDTVHKHESIDKDDIKSKFRQYLIDGKYRLYVGKDSEKNDLLTTRFAKQNDYWFHARGVSGSHVVLRVENSKEPIPKPVLKKAAAIAAYHSKAKTSSLAPVAYTLKKYVVKKKGMDVGKVSLLKEEVLLVRPEIPQGCEFISGE